MAKKIYGDKPKHYPIPHREFIDIDYWDKLSVAERAWLARFEQNRIGSRFLKDGFDADGHDDDIRKEYGSASNRNRRDTATAIRCGVPSSRVDGVLDSADRHGVITAPGLWHAHAGYMTGNRNLEEMAMEAAAEQALRRKRAIKRLARIKAALHKHAPLRVVGKPHDE